MNNWQRKLKLCCLVFLVLPTLAWSSATKWQQQLSYTIEANIDPESKIIQAQADIRYQNNSPHTFKTLVFELPMQLYRNLGLKTDGRLAGADILTASNKNAEPLTVNVNNTFYEVTLKTPLLPSQTIELSLKWQTQLISRLNPHRPRSGYENLSDSELLIGVSEWYPRLLVYDDQYGWDTLPFRGKGEFYPEFADFDVKITAPTNYLLFASAQLQNAGDVLSLEQQTALNTFEQQQLIFQPNPAQHQQSQTWHFKAKKQRDFAFALGNHLLWFTKRIKTSTGDTRLNLVLPNNGRWLWQKYGLAAIEHAVQYLDSNLAPFPFEQMTVVNIAGIGMEYPGFTFVGFRGPNSVGGKAPNYSRSQQYDVIGGTIHEIAHSYFPMLVNTNERREGFYDEGITSYLSYLIEQAWSPDFQSFYGAPQAVIPVMAEPFSKAADLADNVKSKLDSHYHIPATAWHMLASQIIGESKLLSLLNGFIKQHHQQATSFSELVNYLNHHTDVDILPFFQDWFFSNQVVDMAVHHVETTDTGVAVSIHNKGGIRVPLELKLVLTDGTVLSYKVNYQQWLSPSQPILRLDIATDAVVRKIELDPKRISADIDHSNNLWFLVD